MSARTFSIGLLALGLAACFPRIDWVDSGERGDADGDGAWDAEDCAPDDPAIHPGAAETCNGIDDDCDGLVDDDDEGVLGTSLWAVDADGDGYGDAATAVSACVGPEGTIENAVDCDDADAEVHPGATEVCDGADNDCDGRTDHGAVDETEWFFDGDADGWGRDGESTMACEQPEGRAAQAGDCDDTDPEVYPGAIEDCDGEDDDCDGEVDEGISTVSYRDRDDDGWGDPEVSIVQCPVPAGYVADGTDCDDSDAEVHPEAPEQCDGLDHDCDGLVLEDGSEDAATWYEDADGDGYGDAAATIAACEQPAGFSAEATDCDDLDPDVHPGAFDFCGDWADGVDDDCNGVADDPTVTWEFHADADGDGYGAAQILAIDCEPPAGATTDASDCDDTVAAAHPGGVERYAWGIDFDCDGDLVHTASDAAALLLGGSAGDAAGGALAGAADVDGDGLPDLILAATGDDAGGSGAGAAYVFFGADGLPAGEVDATSAGLALVGGAAGDAAGTALAALGDVDGDGLCDLAVGAPGNDDAHAGAGAILIATGAWLTSGTPTLDLGAAPITLFGDAAADGVGTQLSAAGDTSGDGLADLLIGADSRDSWTGAVYLVEGPFSAEVDLTLASAVIGGEDAGDAVGPVAGGFDLDGDGVMDLAVGGPGDDGTDSDAGLVGVFFGPVSGAVGLDDADVLLAGEQAGAYAGTWVGMPGDCDGDGTADLLVGAPGGSTSGWTSGNAYLLLGSALSAWSGSVSMGAAFATFEAEAASDNAGWSVAGGGDVDGDGAPDYLVGAPTEDQGGSDSGAAYLVPGPVEGTTTLATALVKAISTDAYGQLGTAVAFVGDLDGDAAADFLLGVPGDDTAASAAGAAWLFLAGDL